MPYRVDGSDTESTLAPASARAPAAASTAALTGGSTPSPSSISSMTPTPQRRSVGGRAERADLIGRRRKGDEAVPRYRAVRRLDPDDAAQRGGLTHGAARLRTERHRREPGGDRSRGAAARTARYAHDVMRVTRRAERRV